MIVGQVKPESITGKKISEISQRKEYTVFLEVGTLYGLGSTKCFLNSLLERDDDSKLISIESKKEFYDYAKNYWEDAINKGKLDLRHGSLISFDDLPEDYRTDSGHTKHTYDYNQDIKNSSTISIDEKIDVLMLDGGHFSTQLEWELFKDEIKIGIIDDVSASKTRMIYKEILDDSQWVVEKMPDRDLIIAKRK